MTLGQKKMLRFDTVRLEWKTALKTCIGTRDFIWKYNTNYYKNNSSINESKIMRADNTISNT